jgi:drug/metabolite transporter (DMT)-like permease
LGCYAHFISPAGLSLHQPLKAIPVAVICGYVPMWLFCGVLANNDLSRVAVWELLIPVVAFVVTLPWHVQEHLHFSPILGAVLIVGGVLVVQLDVLAKLEALHPPDSPQK